MRRAVRPYVEPWHKARNLKPHPDPSTPDSSSPKFADHARHLKAVAAANRGYGFPWYDVKGRPGLYRAPLLVL